MTTKITEEHAVGIAYVVMKLSEERRIEDGPSEGYEVQRSLLLDSVLTARADWNAEEEFHATYGRGGPDNDDVACDYDDKKGQALIERARAGDADADAVLCGIAAWFVGAGRELPEHLSGYIFCVLMTRRDAPSPRPKRHAKKARNVNIVFLVEHFQEYGFHPTRNRETHNQRSGCSLVAEALSKMGHPISEAGVEEVWRDRDNLTIRDFTVRD